MGAGVRDAFPPPMCCVDCLRVSFGWIARKWLFGLGGIAWKNMMEMGRGGAYVPARVAPQGRIHRSIPRTQCVYFWHGNTATRTFGRAHKRRPYAFCLGDCAWIFAPTVSFGWIAHECMIERDL